LSDQIMSVTVRTMHTRILPMLLLAACGTGDPSCGFEAQSYNMTLEVVEGDCPPEPVKLINFADSSVPDYCHQAIMYQDCRPTISRMCDDGATRALWALALQDDGSYSGQLQVTTVAVDPPLTCRYNARLTPI